jgi:hypothetical protein
MELQTIKTITTLASVLDSLETGNLPPMRLELTKGLTTKELPLAEMLLVLPQDTGTN